MKSDFDKIIKRCKPFLGHIDTNRIEKRRVFLNPYDQLCFNFGWFEIKDFEDFINGTGKIIKGNTQEEKNKFLHCAKFKEDFHRSFMIIHNYNHFDKITIIQFNRYSWDSYIINPIKLNEQNEEEFIKIILCSRIPYLIRELNIYNRIIDKETLEKIHSEFKTEIYGMARTLELQGLGYFGAVNTPPEIRNFSWYIDVIFSYAHYIHLLEHNVEMPDFDFVLENNYRLSSH